jgi:hypothetical protein
MKKFLIYLCFICLALSGCQKEKKLTDEQLAKMPNPQTTGLPQVSGGMTIAVENEVITSDEIINSPEDPLRQEALKYSYETYALQYRPHVEGFVNDMIAKIIVQKKAKRSGGEKVDEQIKQLVEMDVKDYVAQFGGDYTAAEAAIKKDGFESWQDYREYQTKVILSQSYLATQLPPPLPVTHNEMLAFYDKVKKDEFLITGKISFQLIDIQPSKLSPEPNTPVLQTARQLADSLISRLKAGEDFTALAKQYSSGPWAATGGTFEPVEPNSLAAPYDILAKEARNLQKGQIAGPIEKAEHIFIMKLLDNKSETTVPFDKVQGEIRRRILLERRNNLYRELNQKIISQVSVANKTEFVDYCLAKIYEKGRKQSGSL